MIENNPQIQKQEEKRCVQHIVISGGPAAGKTTIIQHLKNKLKDIDGIRFLFVPEFATLLDSMGIINTDIGHGNFEDLVLYYQLESEKILHYAIDRYYTDQNIVVIYDRGLNDLFAYVNNEKQEELMCSYNLTKEKICNRYDLILHLTTSAKNVGYTTQNNPARKETKEQAIIMDDRTLEINHWHKNCIVIPPSDTLEEKIYQVEKIIMESISS